VIDRDSVDRWLEAYVGAWKAYEPVRIGDLFTADAVYRYRPYGDEIQGREAIVTSWMEDDPDKPGTFDGEYRAVAVDEDVAVAVGTSTYLAEPGGEVEKIYDNCYVMRFDDDGRCREFTEWFMQRREEDG
jgi:ketosteroid isomerase-like protein